jgi:hypothetical protein
MNEPKTIKIDNVEYVRKDEYTPAQTLDGLRYVIVRTYSAGCFAGYLKTKDGKEVTLLNARRLWYWEGSASLSQLAEEGVSKPENCKFPQEMSELELTEAIEIIYASEEARLSIASVKVWKE